MKALRLLLLPLLLMGTARAQVDTVFVGGTVVNNLTLRPMPHCLVLLSQGGRAVATRVCDAEGAFFIDTLPTGTYTLAVEAAGLPLFRGDFELRESAELDIRVDTLQRVELEAVTVSDRRPEPLPLVEPRHRLGTELVTSADDRRLWSISGHVEAAPAAADLSGGGPPSRKGYWEDLARKVAEGHPWYVRPKRAKARRTARGGNNTPAAADSTADSTAARR